MKYLYLVLMIVSLVTFKVVGEMHAPRWEVYALLIPIMLSALMFMSEAFPDSDEW